MIRRTLIVFIFFLSSSFPYAESIEDIRLGNIGIEEGLPNSSVSSIIQDKDGFLWFGTQGGLARYDGYEMQVFTQDPFDTNSLSHNLVQTLSLDRDGGVWIGTYAGLDHFDPVSGRISRYDGAGTGTELSNNIVTAILRDSRGRLWAGTLDGLNLLGPDRSFRNYYHDPENPDSIGHSAVRDIYEDSEGRIWFATYGGVSLLDEESGGFINYLDTAIMDIEEAPDDGTLWMAAWDGRLFKFAPGSGKHEIIRMEGHNLYRILFDSTGRLWTAGWGSGLSIVDRADKTWSNYTIGTSDDLAHDIIYSLFQDRSGVIWIGTNGGGINKYVEAYNRFHYLEPAANDESSIPAGKVFAMAETSTGDIWTAVRGKGIYRTSEQNGTAVIYTEEKDNPNSLNNNIVFDITHDSKGRIWVATNNGFCRYRPETDDFERYYHPETPDDPARNIFTRITEDEDGNLWTGTYNNGLIVYTPELDDYRLYSHSPYSEASLSSNLIRDIFQDSEKNIWIATSNGLNLFNPFSETFSRFKNEGKGSLSNNDVRVVREGSDGRLWIGTHGGGISIMNPDTESFSYISRKDGLFSNIIYDIRQTNENEIWIAEQTCISIYSMQSREIRQITASSGLINGEITSEMLISSDGTAWCGGVNGVTKIPLNFDEITPYSPDIRITHLSINGTPYYSDGKTVETGTIRLDYNENNISIELNCDDYTYPENNRFRYRLEGFDQEWTISDKRNYISYTNLQPGNYTFRATGSGSMNNPSRNEVRLELILKPHPAASPSAFLLYTAIAAVLIWLLLINIQRRNRLQEEQILERERINRELEERVRLRTAEIAEARDLAQKATRAKSLFLANMSHELRTPLNGIIGMLELLKKNTESDESLQYIEYSHISAENLLTLLDDILNYEKSMSGKLKLDTAAFSFDRIAEYIQSLYLKQIEDKNLRLTISISPNLPERLLGDEKKIMRIISNLISNAVKYTDSGFIKLEITGTTDEGTCTSEIIVSDSGCGIPENKLDKIFDSFEQLDSSYTKTRRGVGLGLAIVDDLVKMMNGRIEVKSRLFEGSEFRITIPLEIAGGHSEETLSPETQERPAGRPVKILIAEDEAINRLYLSKLLKSESYDFITCVNGREAVEKYTGFKPDIIFMDIGMPEMNGIEAVMRIREAEKQIGTRAAIIMLSAHVYSDDISESMKAGADDFLPKPFNEQEFISHIRKWAKNMIDE